MGGVMALQPTERHVVDEKSTTVGQRCRSWFMSGGNPP
jgi:hypothetical protein